MLLELLQSMSITPEYPCKQIRISQPFGFDNTFHPGRKDFYKLFSNKHPGVDFALPVGTEVYASIPGIVVRKEFHRGMGNVIGTRIGNVVCLYAHLSEFNIGKGDIISTGDLVGLSGKTGAACLEPHLHFEMRDITKMTLSSMVFDPPFGSGLNNYKNTFTYIVNNNNTQKTLGTLSVLYFGDKKYWKKISMANPVYEQKNMRLPQNAQILVPNY